MLLRVVTSRGNVAAGLLNAPKYIGVLSFLLVFLCFAHKSSNAKGCSAEPGHILIHCSLATKTNVLVVCMEYVAMLLFRTFLARFPLVQTSSGRKLKIDASDETCHLLSATLSCHYYVCTLQIH
jgi:hypothetical protein